MSYAQEAAPLRTLLKKGVRWKWTPETQEVFIRVKNLFAKSIQLQRPDENVPYLIYTDASLKGISCVLTQETGDGERKVISTASIARL